jgi:di/tricarboxylate transporter
MDQVVVYATLLAALVMFINGRLRYDLVALLALLILAVAGIVPADAAYAGFGHPAVITVVAVLIISRGLVNAGIVDMIARWMMRVGDKTVVQVAVLTSTVMVCSAFMNNVGALALMMPVAIRLARRYKQSPSRLLMPLAFGSLLGGMTTLIGTPPNIIIATFRARTAPEPFGMFDFTPVGLGVAVVGVIYIAVLGWRLIPVRRGQASRAELFQIQDYISEVRVRDESPLVGVTLRDLGGRVDGDVLVVSLLRGEQRLMAPSSFETLRAGDILLVEADPNTLKELIDVTELELVGSKVDTDALRSGEISVMEAIVAPDSIMRNRTARSLNLRWRYGINLLAVARSGERVAERLGRIRFRPGDILLLQGSTETMTEALPELGCLPLAERALQIGKPRRLYAGLSIFAAALAASALGLLPFQIALMVAVAVMIISGLISLKEAYDSIDWPIIVLLGAMIPVGEALETTGAAQQLADVLLVAGQQMSPVITLVLVLVGTMFLSDVINNAASALLMAPIALGIAQGLGVSADPFLLAVAIGASCAFLTPIGHQSNTLVMGPGGYQFGDYWRIGLVLEVLVVAVSIPLLLLFWPL